MSESRKNHLSIDGGQVKEDDHVASYKSIPDSDTDFKSSKSNLSKSKEKVSPDGAEEKLLQKEDEAKIVRVDMAEATYVVGDHRNGDAKIELDANKRQLSGLTKEELMKYADDPFWVNLRWCMFVLFWAMWLAMLAGAITIIVRAPKCAPPTPREWFEKWPLGGAGGQDYTALESALPNLQTAKTQGIFIDVPTYDVDKPDVLEKFMAFVEKAKKYSIKVIVDLTPNFVSTDHVWFQESENRSATYSDYFIWTTSKKFDSSGNPAPPNNWVSTLNENAWSYSKTRGEFYLHQYGVAQADLNFNNERVVAEFTNVLQKWMQAGASGVRLNKARQLLVNMTFADEVSDMSTASIGADHTQYAYWRHQQTSDQPRLDGLIDKFAAIVDASGAPPDAGETLFTLKEEGGRAELYLLDRNISSLRPPSAAPIHVRNATAAAIELQKRIRSHWPALELKGAGDSQELALFAMLLPATPVLNISILIQDTNDTKLGDLVSLRDEASVEHGEHSVVSVPANNSTETLLVCSRWKAGHTGYVGVYNPTDVGLRANLTGVRLLPAQVTVHHMSDSVTSYTNYTKNRSVDSDNLLVPPESTLVLSFVAHTAVED